jgi:hypothetical protein
MDRLVVVKTMAQEAEDEVGVAVAVAEDSGLQVAKLQHQSTRNRGEVQTTRPRLRTRAILKEK